MRRTPPEERLPLPPPPPPLPPPLPPPPPPPLPPPEPPPDSLKRRSRPSPERWFPRTAQAIPGKRRIGSRGNPQDYRTTCTRIVRLWQCKRCMKTVRSPLIFDITKRFVTISISTQNDVFLQNVASITCAQLGKGAYQPHFKPNPTPQKTFN